MDSNYSKSKVLGCIYIYQFYFVVCVLLAVECVLGVPNILQLIWSTELFMAKSLPHQVIQLIHVFFVGTTMGVSKNRGGHPKWMVYKEKPY